MNAVQALPKPLILGQVSCAHCGLEVPARLLQPGRDDQFCCSGCEQVHHVLHQHGLTEYYRLRDLDPANTRPAQVQGRLFTDFDDAEFSNRYVQITSRGTCETELYLEGVHCAACAWLVEHLPTERPGLATVRLDLSRARAHVEWDPSLAPLSTIARALDRIGYTPHPWREADLGHLRRGEDRAMLLRVGVAAALAMNIMMIQVALYAGEASGIDAGLESLFRWVSLALATPVVAYSAWPFTRSAFQGLRAHVPHIDLPIAVAIWGAWAYSCYTTFAGTGATYLDSIAMLVALLLGGRWVQNRAQRRALETAERLHGGQLVEFARRLEADGTSNEVPVESLRPGQKIEVRSGETLPADGRVIAGVSRVDNAALTGESTPTPVEPGDLVSALTVNLGAALTLEVTAVGLESRVGALLNLMNEAHRRRAPLVALTDRIGRVFVLAVLTLAVVATGAWAWFDPAHLFERVVALLVVSCPCALGLATPVAMTAALTRAARTGTYIKGGDVIQTLGRAREAIFDKTGTLTEGRRSLVRWEGTIEARSLGASLEAQSAHPIARVLSIGWAPRVVTDVEEVPGRGMSGRVDEHEVVIGNQDWLVSNGITLDSTLLEVASDMVGEGLSPVLFGVDGRLAGVAGLGDPLRPEAAEVVANLQKAGWTLRILSGDHPGVVAATARRLGIPAEAARGGLTPEQKVELVREATAAARARGHAVLMVGDGINDAAALASADVGVAVQGGSGASLAAADVVFTRPGLLPLLSLDLGARRVLGTIWRNLAFSLFYNLIGVSLALLGLVGPLFAAVLMPISSVTVITSSVLARSFDARRL